MRLVIDVDIFFFCWDVCTFFFIIDFAHFFFSFFFDWFFLFFLYFPWWSFLFILEHKKIERWTLDVLMDFFFEKKCLMTKIIEILLLKDTGDIIKYNVHSEPENKNIQFFFPSSYIKYFCARQP